MPDDRDIATDEEDRLLIDAAVAVVRTCGDGVLHTVGAAVLAVDGSVYAAVNVFAQAAEPALSWP